MSYAIETCDLSKNFKHQRGLIDFFRPSKRVLETVAVNKVNVKVEEGGVFGLLGPNGAGKTTFIKMLCTLVTPTSGTARIYGFDVGREERQVRGLVGLVASDERSFFWRLTGRENLSFFASLYRAPKEETEKRIDELVELLDLTDVAEMRFNEYSTGMKQRLAIARGLLHKPRILFLDEPTRGLDPMSAHTLRGLIKERVVHHLGNSVLVTTHILSEAEQLCNRIALMDHGKIVANGSIEEIKSSFHNHVTYHLDVKNFSEEDIHRISRIRNVASCLKHCKDDDVLGIEINLFKTSGDISEVLKFIFENNGIILKCTMKETTLEDIFHLIFHDKREIYSVEGNYTS